MALLIRIEPALDQQFPSATIARKKKRCECEHASIERVVQMGDVSDFSFGADFCAAIFVQIARIKHQLVCGSKTTGKIPRLTHCAGNAAWQRSRDGLFL